MPVASILIPVYNRETLVRRAIESAQAQTIADIEIVVVDNASTDGTFDTVAAMAETDRRIRLFRNETNIGPVRNWQACAAHATAPYSKIIFSDDAIAPTYLEKTLPALLSSECGLAYTPAIVGPEAWKGVVQYRAFHGPARIARDYYIRASTHIAHFAPVSPGAAVLRTEDLRKHLLTTLPGVEGYDFNATGAGPDWLVYMLTALAYPCVAYVDEPLVFFHAHANSISGAHNHDLVPMGYGLARQWLQRTVKGL